MEDQPYWMRDDGARPETVSPMVDSVSPMYTPGPSPEELASEENRSGPPTIVWGFRLIHLGLAVMMAATGALSIMEFGNFNGQQLSELVVSLYLLLFALLWFVFELAEIRPIDYVVYHLKRNCGFLFHPMGKALFIIFVAFLNFGVQDKVLGLATGILCLADGVVLILLYLKYPQWYPAVPKS
ncbi:hypothetical protein CTAYLR_005100 [Chrysophaeum taylorii]|uniref:Uncharacterized protein n=1 Tax=Chrysophaeum taylorii TaxID=2483200 RepID=A0AAD7XPF7_9STRA|nr:hypothetical protein CTAYLR_005087 [Chrysophaeum taylorii]KAJ8603495.1 hypothetical protein CTAYLR_005100 [Chrysophaeum taylorii]